MLGYEERRGLRLEIDRARRLRMGFASGAEVEAAVLSAVGTEWQGAAAIGATVGISGLRAGRVLVGLRRRGLVVGCARKYGYLYRLP